MEYEDEIVWLHGCTRISHEKPKTGNHFLSQELPNNKKGIPLRWVLCWHCERQLVFEAVWSGGAIFWCQLWRSLQQHLWTQWLCVSFLMLCFGEHLSLSFLVFSFGLNGIRANAFRLWKSLLIDLQVCSPKHLAIASKELCHPCACL